MEGLVLSNALPFVDFFATEHSRKMMDGVSAGELASPAAFAAGRLGIF
jgi:hypothetical protein